VPYKSKKNRRTISRAPAASAPGSGTSVTAASGETQSVKISTSTGPARTPAPNIPLQTYFGHEFKWITIVSVIIVVLMVAAFYIFR
jgi:hypothetical protein